MATCEVLRADVVLCTGPEASAPTVLLLHAGGERRTVWAPVAAALAEAGLTSVAFDLRGHGESSGEARVLSEVGADVREMLTHLRRPVVAVGTSLGGLAAVAALADPVAARGVVGLVLVDVVPDPEPARVRSWLDRQGLLARRRPLIEDILGRGPELLETVAGLEIRVLLVRGGPASVVTDEEVARLRGVRPGLAVEVVPEAGHLVARDAPGELAEVVIRAARTWTASARVR